MDRVNIEVAAGNIQKKERKVKFLRTVVIAALVAMFVFAGVGPILVAHAGGTAPPPTPPGTLDPGISRYAGVLAVSGVGTSDAQCGSGASSGSFGYFGQQYNLGNETSGAYNWDGTPGANGYQTGLNNSGVCGNR